MRLGLTGLPGLLLVGTLFLHGTALSAREPPLHVACAEGARLEAQGLFAEAAESFRRCWEEHPELLAVHIAWGEALLRARGQQAYKEVEIHLRRALADARSAGQTAPEELQRAEDLLLDIEALLTEDSPATLPADWTPEDLLEILTRPNNRGTSRYDGPRAVLRLRFRPNDTYLGAEAKEELRRVAMVLKHTPLADAVIQIEGHTDSHEAGTEEERKALALRRAEAVRDFLVRTQGVPAERLQTVGLGDDYPLPASETTKGQDENRRVELVNLETKERLLRDVRRR